MTEPPRPTPPPPKSAATTTTTKPKIQHPYRPYPPPNNRRRKSGRSCLRRCFCWTTLVILSLCLLLLAATAGLYLIYNPQRPVFSIASFSTSKLKLSTANRLSTTFSLTVFSRNPNSHSVTFLYDPFTVSAVSSQQNDDVFLGNGTIPEFTSNPKDRTSLKATVSVDSLAVDDGSVNSLRTEMKGADGVDVKVVMDTKVEMKVGFLKSNKVPVRVTCEGIKGVVAPAKKANSAPTSATIGESGRCKVDIRIKIWKFTF